MSDREFNPASADDDVIYIGNRKYVAADLHAELMRAADELARMAEGLCSYIGENKGEQDDFWEALAAYNKAKENLK